MKDWICESCGWTLQMPARQAAPDLCPLCSGEPGPGDLTTETHVWKAPAEVQAALEEGRPLQGIYVEQVVLDGLTLANEIKITNSVVSAWSARAATFSKGVNLAGSRFLESFEVGAGHSAGLGRFANGARFDGPLNLKAAQFDETAHLNGCQIMAGLLGYKLRANSLFDLSGADIRGDCNLSNARLDLVMMRSTRFDGRLILQWMRVARDFSASGITVSGYTQARHSRFEGEFYVGESRFVEEVDLSDAVFLGPATFDATEFQSGLELDSAHFAGRADFHETEFHGWVDIDKAKLDGLSTFNRTRFRYGADLQDTIFGGPVIFRDTEFLGEVYLRRTHYADRLDIIDTHFNQRVDLRDLEVSGPTHFERVAFDRDAYLTKSHFVGPVNWDNVTVNGRLRATGIQVEDDLSWSDCRFQGDLVLTGSQLLSLVDMSGSEVAGIFDLRDASLSGSVELSQCRLNGQLRLAGLSADNFQLERDQVNRNLESEVDRDWETAAREWDFLNQAFEGQNQGKDADFAYYKTRQMKNRLKHSGWGRVRALFELVFNEWGTGYGTRPQNVTVMVLFTVLGFAILYSIVPGVSAVIFEGSGIENNPGLRDYLYYSLTTFTTLGATFFSAGRMIVATEAFVGGFLFALFTTTLTRSIFRN
jgi:hypothetical protein